MIADTREAVASPLEGVVVLAAAGNDFAYDQRRDCLRPERVRCVVAMDRNEVRASDSNFAVRQSPTNVAAPGGPGLVSCEVDIVAEGPGSNGAVTPATPHVAGVAALLTARA